MVPAYVLQNSVLTCSGGGRNSAGSGASSGNTWHGLILGARIVEASFL